MSNTDDNALVEEQTPDTAAVELSVDDSDSADQSQVEEQVEETDAAPAVDPVAEFKKQLRRLPGKWYVIHSYAGYENKVKTNLETRIQNLDVGDYIFQVEVPQEEVVELKNGQKKSVKRKILPGYVLVRMELNDESWGTCLLYTSPSPRD